MMDSKPIKRRDALKRMMRWGKWLALAGVFPVLGHACAARQKAFDREARELAGGLSLRDIARKKLHHGKGMFLNPLADADQGNFTQVVKWKLFSKNEHKQFYDQEQVRPVRIDWESVRKHDGFSVTFLRHSTIMIRDMGKTLLVDPIFDKIFSFIQDFSPREFSLEEMPKPDHILITHGHYDHLNTDSLAILDNKTHVISPLGYDHIFDDLDMRNRTALDWYDSVEKDGFRITLVPCNHWTVRNPVRGRNRSLWGSFVIETPGGQTVFVSGDVAWFDGYKELGREFNVDLAVFNLGAYEPRWFMYKSHMNPEEVLRAFRDLGAEKLMIVHWGTFRLGNEPVHFPPIDMKNLMDQKGLSDRLVHLDHGRTVIYDGKKIRGVV